MQLVISGLNMALHILKKEGSFVAKVFRGKDFVYLFLLMQWLFKEVFISKPRCCWNSSVEGFIVCWGFDPKIQISETLNSDDCINELNAIWGQEELEETYFDEFKVPEIEFESFYVGEEESLDPDMNYPLSFEVIKGKKYEFWSPIQMPIDPPYMEFLKQH